MAVQVFHVEEKVDAALPYLAEPNFIDHVRSTAARAMGEKLIRDASKFERFDPKKDEPPYVRFRWSIGIERDMAEIEMRQQQARQARLEGRFQAVAILETAAKRYSGLDGGCAGVIAAELREQARKIGAIED